MKNNLEKKKIATTKAKKSASKKTLTKRRKKRNLKQYFPAIIIASFTIIFLLWRVVVLVPKMKNSFSEKQSISKIEKSEEKFDNKSISQKESTKAQKKKNETFQFQTGEKDEGKGLKHSGKTDLEETKQGNKPKEKEIQPFLKQNENSIEPNKHEPRCSIVIDDVGSNIELLKYAMKVLPKTTTFAIIPFQKYSKESAEILHGEGFHIILHSPMEAEERGLYYNTEYVIKSSMTKRQIKEVLQKQFEEVPYAEGMNNHTGSKATKDPDLMRSVMLFAKEKKIFFLDSRTTPFTVAYKIAVEEGVPAAERKVFLDDDNRDSGIILKVDELALLAHKEEKAVAIGHLRENTIKVLESRIPYWQKRGVNFISLSDIIKK